MSRMLLTAAVLVAGAAALGAMARGHDAAPATALAPELVGPGVISTPLDELNAAITPDGNEMYYSLNGPNNGVGLIVVSRRRGGRWSEPEMASFSGRGTDYDPFVHPDGTKLFFISNRQAPGKEADPRDFDIWMVTRTGDGGWSEPTNLGAPVNSTGAEYYPSVTQDGTLYFSSRRQQTQGGFDIYRSRLVNGAYTEPEDLGPAVNKTTSEVDIYVAPDESYIVFVGYGRQDTMGSGDLYISYRNADDTWTESANLGAVVNSSAREYCPIGSPDGQYFYWTSMRGFADQPPAGRLTYRAARDSLAGIRNGNGNIYRVPMAAIHANRPR